MRLRPALVREDRAGNDQNYRRLLMLDSTLERIIQRFEDEYPETKVAPLPSPPDRRVEFEFSPPSESSFLGSSPANGSVLSASVESNNNLERVPQDEAVDAEAVDAEADDNDAHPSRLARNGSNASLAARAQMQEEGQMHKLGQAFRKTLVENSHRENGGRTDVAQVRERLEQFSGEQLREQIEEHGLEHLIKKLGFSMQEIALLEREDPEGFEKFKQAQQIATLNAGQRTDAGAAEQPSIYAAVT